MSRKLVMRKIPILMLLLGSLLATSAEAQTTYRWLDKSGKVHYSDQPPPADIGSVEEKQLGKSSVIETSGPGYATRTAAANFPVTLYSSADCVDACKQARELLNRRHIPYSEKVIRTSDDADAFKQATKATEVFVPSLGVGSQFQRGFLDSGWNTLLDNAGYPGAR
jgi:glutaredoxin